jgi:hypothetical protein
MPKCLAKKEDGTKCTKRPIINVKGGLHGLGRLSCKGHIESNWSESFLDTNDGNIKRIRNPFYQPNTSDLSNHERELQWIIDFIKKKKVSDVDDDDICAVLLELLTTEYFDVDLRVLRTHNSRSSKIHSCLMLFPNASRSLKEEAAAVVILRAGHLSALKRDKIRKEERKASGLNPDYCSCGKHMIMYMPLQSSSLKKKLQFKCWTCLQSALIELAKTDANLSHIPELGFVMWENPMYDSSSSDSLVGTSYLSLRIGTANSSNQPFHPVFHLLGAGNVVSEDDSEKKKKEFCAMAELMKSDYEATREKSLLYERASRKESDSMQDKILAESFGGIAPTLTSDQITKSLAGCGKVLDSVVSQLSSPSNLLIAMGNVSSLVAKTAGGDVTFSIYQKEHLRKVCVWEHAIFLTPEGFALTSDDYVVCNDIDEMTTTSNSDALLSVLVHGATGAVSQDASRQVEKPLIELIQSYSTHAALISSEGSRYNPGQISSKPFSQANMVILSDWHESVLSGNMFMSADLPVWLRKRLTNASKSLEDLSCWKIPGGQTHSQSKDGSDSSIIISSGCSAGKASCSTQYSSIR